MRLSYTKTPIHELKILPEYYQAVIDGLQIFEIRYNDRNYRVGDVLVLKEWDGENGMYTGRECKKQVMYITNYAQQDGYVVMAFSRTYSIRY